MTSIGNINRQHGNSEFFSRLRLIPNGTPNGTSIRYTNAVHKIKPHKLLIRFPTLLTGADYNVLFHATIHTREI